MGVLVYAEDHDSSLPPGLDGNKTWCQILLPWVEDYQIYDCPVHLGGYTDNNSYMANGSAWGFWWVGGNTNGKPTFLATVKQPSRLCLIHEDTEDWELGNRGTAPGSRFGTGSASGNGSGLEFGTFQMKLNYYDSFNPQSKGNGGRHFRGGGGQVPGFGGAKTDPWGFDNINFADGHVGAYSMEGLVKKNINRYWYEYPFTASAGRGLSINQATTNARPGSEWWTPPQW